MEKDTFISAVFYQLRKFNPNYSYTVNWEGKIKDLILIDEKNVNIHHVQVPFTQDNLVKELKKYI